MPLAFAKSTVSTTNRAGMIIRLTVGETWDADDEFVKDHPGLFSAIPPRVRTSQGWAPAETAVETATAKPGEKRRIKRG